MKKTDSPILTVCYLDDEPELTALFHDAFTSKLVNIITFNDSKSAYDYLKSNHVDMFFVDYCLRDTKGDQFCQKLKMNIPCFLITGDLDDKFSYNFKKVIVKPMRLSEIQSLIDEELNFTNREAA